MAGVVARLRSYWRGVWRGGELSREVEAEFRFHIEERTADLVRSGLPPAEAARRARLEFGSAERYAEETRAARGLAGYDDLRADVRYAWRSLRQRPVFTTIAVLMLGIGAGANAAVFSLVNAALLRPLPFDEPDRLVVLHQTVTEQERAPRPLRWSYPEYEAVRDVLQTLESVTSFAPAPLHLSLEDGALRTLGEFVSAGYFGTLRIGLPLGRTFDMEEDVTPGAHPVAVVSHELWQQQYGAASDVLGRTLVLNGVPLEIIGVAPAGFRGLTGQASLWVPQAMAPSVSYEAQLTSPQQFHSVIGRLRPGVTVQQANAEVASVGAVAAAGARVPNPDAWTAGLLPLDEARRSPDAMRARAVLAGVALLVLLIASVNLAALLLARSVGRSRELALRTALGAGRRRLVRHILAEGAVIGVAGAVLGMLIAAILVRTLAGVATERLAGSRPWIADLTAFDTPSLDWRVATFGVTVAVGAALVAALVPALRATRGDLSASLNAGARGSTVGVGNVRRPTLLSAAAIAQVACALVLLSGAALLLDAFERLRNVDPGFVPDGLVTLSIAGPFRESGEPAAAHAIAVPLLEQVLERVQAVPGVTAATLSFCTPFMWCSSTVLHLEGVATDDAPIVGRHYVAPDHFRTLGIPVLRGRTLSADDRPGRPRVAVINETAARQFWPGEDPIGRRIRFGSGGGFASPDSLTEIVGVVGDVVYGSPGDPTGPDFYTSYLQFTWPRSIVTVRAADPLALVPALRRAVTDANVGLEVHDVRTMVQRGQEALSDERFAANAVAAFAAIGLLLASLGLYGVMAYSVAQRRREIGIRIALGATRAGTLRMVLAHGTALAAVGLVIGLFVAATLARTLSALVPHVQRADPSVLAFVAVLLLAVCAAACALPARAATRVDPVETLATD